MEEWLIGKRVVRKEGRWMDAGWVDYWVMDGLTDDRK